MLKTKERINKYDNLKGLAIFLIVLCHLPGLLSPAFDHRVIYIFHLPIFFFVAGYFSKIGPDEPIKAFKRLLIPYLLFSIIWKIYSFVMVGSGGGRLFIEPGVGLWFLISLFTMKMFLPIINRFRYPVLFALIGALLIGVVNIPGNLLGITRTFIYLPVFLIGFYYKDYNIKLTNYNERLVLFFKKRHIQYLILILLLILGIVVAYNVPAKVILLQHPYKGKILEEMFFKFIVISLGILFALTLNNVMTNRKCFLTKLGKNSMAVYILHPYIVKYILKPFILENFNQGILFSVIVISLTLIITFVLSRDFVSTCLNKLFDAIFKIFVNENKEIALNNG